MKSSNEKIAYEKVLCEYIHYAALHGELKSDLRNSEVIKKGNKIAKILNKLEKSIILDMKLAEYIIDSAIHHTNASVRLWIASFAARNEINYEEAILVLKELSQLTDERMVAIDAKMTLFVLNR